MSFKNLRNLKQVTLFISIFLLISQNSCKIQDAPSNNNVTGFVDIAKLRPEMKVEQSEVFNWIAANIPDEHKSSLQLNHMQQRFIDNHHVIKIPINDGAALFFTKDSAKLKAFAYKWDDRDPGTKRYTGHIISYSFQDFSVRALKYYEGKKISDGTLINNSSSFFPGKGPVSTTLKNTAATQGLLATSGENKLRTMSILSDIWCVLTGGTVYAIVGDTGNGCDYSNGWIASLMGFLEQVFGGSGNSNPASYGSDPAAAVGTWYGPSAYTGPSPTQGGGAGNGNTPATQPYTGGPVWVSQWVDTTNLDNCMAMDEFGNMVWVPGGCSTGYWQSVQINAEAGITSNDLANAIPVDNGKIAIDPQKYINCFNDGKTASSYKLTLYVYQPVPGTTSQWTIGVAPSLTRGVVYTTPENQFLDVGHTFVGFQKINTDGTSVTQVMGFYPGTNPTNSVGIVKDDGNHPYSVSYTATVNETKFFLAIGTVKSNSLGSHYILSNVNGGIEYNCTDAGIAWVSNGDVQLPANASRGFFTNTPGDYGQALRGFTGANTTPGTAPQSHGPCN